MTGQRQYISCWFEGLQRTRAALFTVALIVFSVGNAAAQLGGGNGWIAKNLQFHVQWPYNTNLSDRYTFTNGVYHLWVYSNDVSFEMGNATHPRTEQRFDPDYTNGEVQYQSMMKVPSDENSYCIFQIHTGNAQSPTYGSTTLMLFWFSRDGGSVHDYSGTELTKNLGNQWFQLNVDHNVATRTIRVWINQNLVWTQQDNGAGDFYMKDGVYEQTHGPTDRMDTYISNIVMWTRPSGPYPLTWSGRTNGVNVSTWDLGNTTNWVNTADGARQVFHDGDRVTFDDSAPGTTLVTLQALVQPSSIAVNNTLKNYILAGSGSLGGPGSLSKQGAGMLTLDTANEFTGGVIIGGGTVKVGNAGALGDNRGTTVVTNGGTLDVDGFNLTPEAVTVSGSGVGGNGAIVNHGGQQTSALRTVTLAGNTIMGGSSRWDIRNSGGAASLNTRPAGSPFNLVKVGTNQVSLVGVSSIDPALGNIDIRQGTFAIQTSTVQVGDPNKAITIHSGATLDFWTLNSTPLNKKIVVEDGGLVFNEKGPSVVAGPLILDGKATFNLANYGSPPSLTLTNVVSGGGDVTVVGGGDLVLSAENTYTGITTISQGRLALTGNGSISNSTHLQVAAGAILDAGSRIDGSLSLAAGQTLSGNGTLAGNVVVGNGASLSTCGAIGALMFENDLTLAGGSTTAFEVSQSSQTNAAVQVSGTLTYGGTLVVSNLDGIVVAAGDWFQLFHASAYNGEFTNLIPPTPGPGLAWNGSGLTNGVLNVVAALQPQIMKVCLVAENLLINGSGGSTYGSYSVLASTNLTLPLDQWVSLGTNHFDAAGNFSFTNSLNPSLLGRFFLLRLR